MSVETQAKGDRLWVYTVLPAILLNLVGCVILGAYYGLEAQQPELAAAIGEGQAFFAMYVFISLVEWAFAASILLRLKRDGVSVLSLVAPEGSPWRIRWTPAILVFVAFNALFAAYVALYACALGGWPSFEDWTTWQRVFMVAFVPLSAGFCEELIWRGYVITRLEARGRKGWSAILLSASSCAWVASRARSALRIPSRESSPSTAMAPPRIARARITSKSEKPFGETAFIGPLPRRKTCRSR